MVLSVEAMALRLSLWFFWGVVSLLFGQRVCPVDKAFLRVKQSAVALQPRQSHTDTLWVPVVFHLIAQDSSGWLPDSRIASQMRALNRDFAQAKIQFYLPRYGPQGEPTCGVTRTLSPYANHDWTSEENTLKNLIQWPPDSFVNIWVVERMVLNTIGYARALRDTEGVAGVVLVASVVGDRDGAQVPYDWGRTAVHEMGHVFSLYHPFEGGCVGMTPQTCATEGDEICDTPPQARPHYGCPSPVPNTCSETPTDRPDPLDNLMGYVDDSCMEVFTPQQAARMRDFLIQAGPALISEENHVRRGRTLAPAEACAAVAALPSVSQLPLHWSVEGSVLRIHSPDPCTISLYDALGRQILRTEGVEVSVAHLPEGAYVGRIERQGIVQFFRFWWACGW